MKLFLHTNLPRVDLSDYGNATREFLDSIAHMVVVLCGTHCLAAHCPTLQAVTLTSLSLADCPLIAGILVSFLLFSRSRALISLMFSIDFL
jgi:hypothetical protein